MLAAAGAAELCVVTVGSGTETPAEEEVVEAVVLVHLLVLEEVAAVVRVELAEVAVLQVQEEQVPHQ